MTPKLKQTLLLSLISFLFVLPFLLKTGTNVVTRTYEQASVHIWQGQSPYAAPTTGTDWFKYSPFFAMSYRPFAQLPETYQALCWALLNIVVFWWGLSQFFLFKITTPKVYALGLLLCSMELDISLRYQQVNALLTGLMLLGLSSFNLAAYKKSAWILSLATNLKIVPIFMGAALALPFKKKYFMTAITASLLLLIVPAFFFGWTTNFMWLKEWFTLIQKDTQTQGLLDLQTTLNNWNQPTLALLLPACVIIMSLSGIYLAKIISKKDNANDLFNSAYPFCFIILPILLLSPRTESPTFVLLAPCYLFILNIFYMNTHIRLRNIYLLVFTSLGFLVTFSFTDAWPHFIWNPHSLHYASKPLGTLGLLVLVYFLCLKEFYCLRDRRK